MKKLAYILMIALAAMISISVGPVFAQKTSPQVPITYPGDTNEIIKRRAQWIERANKEGILVWWGTATPEEGRRLTAEFNKIYPFIKVSYWRGRGEEIAAKVEAEHMGGRYTADVLLGGEYRNFPRWREMGLIAKLADIIPGIEKMDKRSYGKYGDWVIPGFTPATPQYNTKLVMATEAPKDWEDLLAPKWKGKIGISTDMKIWETLALSSGGWGLEKTESFLTKLRGQNLIWQESHSSNQSLLIAGEFPIAAEGYIYHAFQSQAKGAPVEWVRTSVIPVVGSCLTMAKNAPHPNAAMLFIEWMLSSQGLITFEQITMKGSVFPGTGTRQAKALEGLKLSVMTEDDTLKVIELGLDEKFTKLLGITAGK